MMQSGMFILQVILPFNPSTVSQLPGSDPHGLCHLSPAEGADCVHLRNSPLVTYDKLILICPVQRPASAPARLTCLCFSDHGVDACSLLHC